MTTQSLRNRILGLIRSHTARRIDAWLVWCDPSNMWTPLLRMVLSGSELTLVEVGDRTAGELGGPVTRTEVQAHIDAAMPFVLAVDAAPDDLGWLWGQALRAEGIYGRSLRDQFSAWGWRPQTLHISDDELLVLAQQNIDLDPASWSGGGLEPDLDLLLSNLLLATGVEQEHQVLLHLSAERAGLPALDLENLPGWRARSLAHLMVTDAQRYAPEIVPDTHEYVIQLPGRTLALQLLDRCLDSRAWSAELPRALDAAEGMAALDYLVTNTTAQLGLQGVVALGPFISRRAEQAVFVETCRHLGRLEGRPLLEALAEIEPSLQRHTRGLWADEKRDAQRVRWDELVRLGAACRELIEMSPAQAWTTPGDALQWYTTGGWRVDRAGEELLRNLGTSDPALVDVLPPLRAAFRARWEQQLMQWSEIWSGAGCPVPDVPTAGEWLRTVLAARRPTAVIVLDALRYDLGATLAALINTDESVERATVSAARAPLPSITAVGMPMTLPISEADLAAEVVNGAWVVRERGQGANLSIAAERRNWWQRHGGVAQDAILTVAGALNTEVPRPANERPRLLVYDDAIDALGHDDELEAMGSREVLRRYVQVIQRLRDAGWQRIAIVTDHGFIHWSGAHDQRVAQPLPGAVYASRRACAYPVGATLLGPRGTAPGGAFAVAAPSGVSCYSAYGKRGYFHGGASLQEWIIPAVVVDWPARATPVAVILSDIPNILTQRPRVTLNVVATMFLDEVLPRSVEVVIRDAVTRAILFTSDSVTVKPTDTSVENMMKLQPGVTVARGTALVVEARDPHTEAVIATATSRLMIELDSW